VKEAEMPKVSWESAANVESRGPAEERHETLDGYRVGFVKLDVDADLTPLLQGLPNDQCPCPHWGYVFKGRMWWRFGDTEEVYEAGDAFYVPGGHTSGADANSEFLVYSPADQMAPVEAHMARRAQELQGA
jgi:hypothetical protein